MKPLASILISSYNFEKYVKDTLKSIENQNFPKDRLEVVVVDDFSSDSTVSKIREFAQEASFNLKLHANKSNLGRAYSKNLAFDLSQGDFIFHVDGDDLIHKEAVSKCMEVYNNNPEVGFVYTGHAAMKDESTFPISEEDIIYVRDSKPNFEIKSFLEGDYNYISHLKSVRRNFNVPFDSSFCYSDDADWLIRIGLNGVKFGNVPEVLYYWRKSNNSSTSNLSSSIRDNDHNKAFQNGLEVLNSR